ncbi:hypothetical protein MSPP1_003664 [Malassezia sp. CBS 17886]|nr:hypothetical protein MSPP1_003664 [Malassezia sp. CBS 17886]
MPAPVTPGGVRTAPRAVQWSGAPGGGPVAVHEQAPPPRVPVGRAGRGVRETRVVMSTATAQRRISWNACALAVLWGLPSVWPRSVDVYYDVLDVLVHTRVLSPGTDELVDGVLSWLRCALYIIFILNIAEAGISWRTDTATSAAPPLRAADGVASVGQAFARSVSVGSATDVSQAASRRAASPSWTPSPVTPISARRSLSSTPARRSVSPFQRRASGAAQPTAASLGRGRPTTSPFRARTPSSPRRTMTGASPTLLDALAGRSASVPRSSPTSLGAHALSDLDDAREVEEALLELQTGCP